MLEALAWLSGGAPPWDTNPKRTGGHSVWSALVLAPHRAAHPAPCPHPPTASQKVGTLTLW